MTTQQYIIQNTNLAHPPVGLHDPELHISQVGPGHVPSHELDISVTLQPPTFSHATILQSVFIARHASLCV